MVRKAQQNAAKLDYMNVEFLLGDIESLPLAEESADVVVSNCVFNLVPDKERAFNETFRILKKGGHFSISDIVLRGSIPSDLKYEAELYVGCVAGAIDKKEYLQLIKDAGFSNIKIQKERKIELPEPLIDALLSDEKKEIYKNSDFGIYSVNVYGEK
jgi:SAM-dependent methyltransferase